MFIVSLAVDGPLLAINRPLHSLRCRDFAESLRSARGTRPPSTRESSRRLPWSAVASAGGRVFRTYAWASWTTLRSQTRMRKRRARS